MTAPLTAVSEQQDRAGTERLPIAPILTLGFGMLGINLAWQIYNACIPIFLQAGRPDFVAAVQIKGFALDPTTAGFIMTLDNIAAVFLLPFIGVLSDRTRTRFGRRIPYIMLGLPIAIAAFLAIPAAFNISLVALLAVIGVFLVAMDIFRTPLGALMPDLTPSPHRSTAAGLMVLLSSLGTVMAYALGGMLLKKSASAPFLLGGIGLAVTVLAVLLFVREPKRIAEEANTHAAEEAPSVLPLLKSFATETDPSARLLLLAVFTWTTASSAMEIFMSSFILKRFEIDAGTATMMMAFFGMAALVAAFPAGLLGKKFGRRPVIQAGLIIISLIMASVLVVPSLMVMRFLLIGMGLTWALVMVNGLPMVLDLSRSRDTGGTYSGLFLLANQAASIVGPVLAGAVLDAFKRDYRMLFVYIPVLMLTAMFLLRYVRKGEAYPQ